MEIISASILSADFTRLGEQIAACEAAGADWIHVDVMDGVFVPNLTMGPFIVEACRRATSLPLDVHLMIEHPERHLKAFASAGASNLTVHVEACTEIERTVKTIQELGCKAGITLKPATPAASLMPGIASADLVLVMTVEPGYSGQSFMPEMMPKVRQVRAMLESVGNAAWLEVDGGIAAGTIEAVRSAGANAFVAAKAIFGHPLGIAVGIRTLRSTQG